MSFSRYPEYKDSGVEWLGEVPGHWKVLRIKHFLKKLEQGWSPQCEAVPVESADEWGVLKVGCVNGGIFNALENKALPPELEPIPELGIQAGDLLISRANTRELVGSAAVALSDFSNLMLCDKLFRLRFDPSVCVSQFVAAYLAIGKVRGQIELAATGASSSMLNIGQSTILEMEIALPDSDEQASICEFLLCETAKIDGLMAEQEKLIALLKEKRQAVISQAVTKGLDPTVPMRDSGVEWLGEVPSHWKVARIKDVARLESGHTPSKTVPQYWEDCDIPWVSLNDSKQLAVTDYITETAYQINELGLQNSSARMLPEGSVVLTRDATIGLTAIITRPMAVSQHLVAWCPTGQIDPLYLLRVFNAMKEHLDSFTFGATIKTIGMADIKRLVTPVPPISEQVEIAAFIGKESAQLDALINDAQQAIALLKERRTALISAAVTGQIDVRGLVKDEQEKAA